MTRLFWIATLIFLALTSFYVTSYNPYQPTSKEWLSNPDFKAGFDGWKVSNPEWVKQDAFGVVTLSLPEHKKHLALYQRFDIDSRLPQVKEGSARPTPLLLQLSGVARTFSIDKGDKYWHRGRFSLVFYDEKGKRVSINALPLPHHNLNWRAYRKTFEVPKQVASVRVNVNILQVAGTVQMQVKDINLMPVALKPEAKWVQMFGLVAWVLMMIWLMSSYARYFWSRSKGGVLLVAALMVGAIVSGDIKSQLMNQLPELMYSITPFLTLDKDVFAHFLFFFIAAIILVTASRHKRWWQVVIDLALLGLFIECAQVFVEGRTADAMDLWVNMVGIMAGGVVAGCWLFFRAMVRR